MARPAHATPAPAEPVRRKRGRPVGTGIDDRAIIARITALMAADPTLKPTTAIRRAGITNPSVVRRLRDKVSGRTPVQTSAAIDPPPVTPRPAVPRHTAGIARPARSDRSADPVPARDAALRAAGASTAPAPSRPEHVPLPPDPEPDAKRKREALLLAAYLEALAAQHAPPGGSTSGPVPPRQPAAPPPVREPDPASPRAPPAPDHQEKNPARPVPGGFTFPFFPPFMQPYTQPPAASAPAADPNAAAMTRNMEAFRLSIEALTATSRLQLYLYQNALAGTPLGVMLQGQAWVGQMLLASLAGFAKPPEKK